MIILTSNKGLILTLGHWDHYDLSPLLDEWRLRQILNQDFFKKSSSNELLEVWLDEEASAEDI